MGKHYSYTIRRYLWALYDLDVPAGYTALSHFSSRVIERYTLAPTRIFFHNQVQIWRLFDSSTIPPLNIPSPTPTYPRSTAHFRPTSL